MKLLTLTLSPSSSSESSPLVPLLFLYPTCSSSSQSSPLVLSAALLVNLVTPVALLVNLVAPVPLAGYSSQSVPFDHPGHTVVSPAWSHDIKLNRKGYFGHS